MAAYRIGSLAVQATLVNSMLTLAPQLIALVVLQPRDFGRFSIVYLLFARGRLPADVGGLRTGRGASSDGATSGAADPRLPRRGDLHRPRCRRAGGCRKAQLLWHRLSVTAWSWAWPPRRRASARLPRYASLLQGDWRGALRVDAAACVLLIIGRSRRPLPPRAERHRGRRLVLGRGDGGRLRHRAQPGAGRAGGPCCAGLRKRRRDIAPLTLDSLVQDISSIGAPYAIAPILGLANFGIYRAISNVAAHPCAC